ncbi:unnamed protein product [Brugia pahangi]|uniref:Uncharacterized protein n=1 Tax=Brugia pahangi TaxID=6280 RepID=A0A0N4TTM1_BRUPA|nr:unnamed protein product [Brugia pahangi]
MSISDTVETTFSEIDFNDHKAMIEKLNDFGTELHKLLYQYNSDNVEKELRDAEEKIGIKSEYFGFLTLTDSYAKTINAIFPFYWLIKFYSF